MGFILLNLTLFTYLRNSLRAEQFLLRLPHKKQSIRGGAENEPCSPPVSSHNLVPQETTAISQLLSGPERSLWTKYNPFNAHYLQVASHEL